MQQRKVLITGVSKGLGNALVREFAAQGHAVAGCARTDAAMRELQREMGNQHHLTTVDLTRDAAVAAWIESVKSEWGTPDLVINNASIINANAPLWEVPFDQFELLMASNVTATFSVIQHVVPSLIEKGSGVIANISSGWGRSVSADVASYCASKWAIEGLTLALAEDLPPGLAAVSVNPGVINTDILQSCFGPSADNAPEPEAWSKAAVPFFLGLGKKDNGKQLSV